MRLNLTGTYSFFPLLLASLSATSLCPRGSLAAFFVCFLFLCSLSPRRFFPVHLSNAKATMNMATGYDSELTRCENHFRYNYLSCQCHSYSRVEQGLFSSWSSIILSLSLCSFSFSLQIWSTDLLIIAKHSTVSSPNVPLSLSDSTRCLVVVHAPLLDQCRHNNTIDIVGHRQASRWM